MLKNTKKHPETTVLFLPVKNNTPRSVFSDMRRSVDPQTADELGMFVFCSRYEIYGELPGTNLLWRRRWQSGRCGANEASRYLLCFMQSTTTLTLLKCFPDECNPLHQTFSQRSVGGRLRLRLGPRFSIIYFFLSSSITYLSIQKL